MYSDVCTHVSTLVYAEICIETKEICIETRKREGGRERERKRERERALVIAIFSTLFSRKGRLARSRRSKSLCSLAPVDTHTHTYTKTHTHKHTPHI